MVYAGSGVGERGVDNGAGCVWAGGDGGGLGGVEGVNGIESIDHRR